jgi:acyl carrier protein
MAAEIREKLLDFISGHFRIPRDRIDPQGSLVDQGVIDSFGFVEIASFLETEFAIAVPDDQINGANFSSVARIVDFVTAAAPVAVRAGELPWAG